MINTNNKPVLLLGIGNILMGDEGVGIHAIERAESFDIPEWMDTLDGGTGGFHLLEYFEKYRHVVMIDATLDDKTTGSWRKITPRYASDFPRAMSTHDIGLKDLVSALHLSGRLPEITLYVISIESIQQQGIYLTDKVNKGMEEVLQDILATVHEPLAVV
ncbi:MAG TPA: hydrogenase maturation protease [Saprospiraceae bacterium]|nr:hydrogenase maturation protease [Saprospiraceae bacterium]